MELKTQCRERFKPAVDEINEIIKQEDNTESLSKNKEANVEETT